MTTSGIFAGLLLFAAGVILGRVSREREVRKSQASAHQAWQAAEALSGDLFEERSRRQSLENATGMRGQEGRRVWN